MKYINKEIMNRVYDILTNKLFLAGVIVILIFLVFKQCEMIKTTKSEVSLEHNNYLAARDSVRVIKEEIGKIIVEKSSYQKKVSQLEKDQIDLIKRLELKSNGKKTTPKTVVQIVTKYKDSIVNIPSEVIKDPNGSESIVFTHEPSLPGKNRLKISGKVPYQIDLKRDSRDSTKYIANIIPRGTSLNIEQNIDIVTGIYQDPKSKRIMTRITTDYPNLRFNEINSFDITDNPETRKALKSARKEFGFGVNFGYGIIGNSKGIDNGFYIGVGVHYSPRFLQFGK